MKCYICDRDDDLIVFDKQINAYSPCTTCQEAINECLEAFPEEEETEEFDEGNTPVEYAPRG